LLIPHRRARALAAFLVLLTIWLVPQFERTIEATVLPVYHTGWSELTSFDWLLRFGIVCALLATIWAVYRLLLVWEALQGFLSAVAETPLTPVFERLPGRVARLLQPTLFAPSSRETLDSVTTVQWRLLRRVYSATATEFERVPEIDPSTPGKVEALMDLKEPWRAAPQRARKTEMVVPLGPLYEVLEDLWRAEPPTETLQDVGVEVGQLDAAERMAKVSTMSRYRGVYRGPARYWLRLAEEFVAVQVVAYILWVLLHLRRLALFLLVSLLLMTVLVSGYSFQPQSLVKLILLFVLLATVGSLIIVMLEMSRDDLLSRISKTEPGRVNWSTSFVLNLVLVGVVPLLALVSSEFPAVRALLFSWLNPFLREITKL
jgi:hypothetical protein